MPKTYRVNVYFRGGCDMVIVEAEAGIDALKNALDKYFDIMRSTGNWKAITCVQIVD